MMLFSDPLGIEIRPEVVTLFGVMLAFVYQQKQHRHDNDDEEEKDKKDDN
jgi:hypothetical protein